MFNRLVLICLATMFRLVALVRGRGPRPLPPAESIRRVLLTSTTALGDTVMFTSALSAARQCWPQAEIHVFLHRRWSKLFRADSRVDQIIEYPGKFRQLGRVIGSLRAVKPDLALIIHGNDPDIVPLMYLSGAGFVAGWSTSRFDFLMDRPVEFSNMKGPLVERFLEVLQASGCEPGQESPKLHLPEDVLAWANEEWRQMGLADSERLILLNPGGSHQAKQWPEENWRDFLVRLSGQPDIRLALIGSPAEAGKMNELAVAIEHSQPLVVARNDIVQAAALMTRAQALVAPDSGLSHVAAALGVPLAVLFGPDDPKITGPYQPSAPAAVIMADPSVCPDLPGCRRKTCEPNKCMAAITSDMVIAALKDQLKLDWI